MMRRPANILLLAIVIGAFAAALVYRYVRSQQEAMEAAMKAAHPAATTTDTVPVVVASEVIPIGAKIAPAQLKVVDWPKIAQPDGVFASPDAVGGRFTRVSI